MLEGIEALVALERFETVSEAAVRLRLTQSAVSKRLQALERSIGGRLLERDGRRVRLTPRAIELLERARPLLLELRELAAPPEARGRSGPVVFSLAIADSIAASWGPRVVRDALAKLPQISVELHAHRSVLIVESVRLGRYQLGLSTEMPGARDLIHYPIAAEAMVLVKSGGKGAPLITIEPTSATWRAIEPALKAHHARIYEQRRIGVESFGAALQMVKAGFGDGIVPLGLAREAGVEAGSYRPLNGVERRIALLARKSAHQLPEVAQLCDGLKRAAARNLAARNRRAPAE